MDVQKIITFIIVLFYLQLSNSAPILNGWTQIINASNESESDVQTGVVISSNETYTNIIRNNLTEEDLSQREKSTSKIFFSDLKNKIESGKGNNVKDGGIKVSGTSGYKPYPTGTGGGYTTAFYIGLGVLVILTVVGFCTAVAIDLLKDYFKNEKGVIKKLVEKTKPPYEERISLQNKMKNYSSLH